MSELIDLSNPKESAVLDLLALAIAADGHVDVREIAFAADRLQALLGFTEKDDAFVEELGTKIGGSIQRLKEEGPDVFMQSAVANFDSAEEREMVFALCAALVCVDGGLAPGEAEYLCQLRVLLGMSEAQVLSGVVAISTQLLQQEHQKHGCK